MAKKMKSRVQFFKVMMNNFAQQLLLPPEFVRNYGDLLPENAKIRCSSGRTWDVKLQRMEGENRCSFTRGWSKFAEDFELKQREFVEFIFDVPKSTFDVSVWGINGVEREILGKSSRALDKVESKKGVESSRGNEVESDDEETRDNAVEEMTPHFKIKLKDHHFSRVSLHQQFLKAAGLMGHQAVTLRYPPEKRCWSVVLDHRPQFRIDMARGWTDFRKGNKLVFGKTYLFEYIREENVIEVKPIKGGN